MGGDSAGSEVDKPETQGAPSAEASGRAPEAPPAPRSASIPELDQLRAELNGARRALRDLESRLEHSQTESTVLKHQLDAAVAELGAVREGMAGQISFVQTMERVKEEMNRRLADAEAAGRERSDIIQQMGADLQLRQDEILRLRDQEAAQAARLEEEVGRAQAAQAQMIEQRDHLQAAEATAQRWRQAAHKAVQELGAKSKDLVERYQLQVERLTIALDDLRVRHEGEKTQIADDRAQAEAELNQRLRELNDAIGSLRAERDELAVVSRRREDKSKRKTLRITALERQIADAEAERRRLLSSVSWRVTAPVRAVGSQFSKAGRRMARARRGLGPT